MSDDQEFVSIMQMFDRKYMQAVDLGGKERVVTIERIEAGKLQNKSSVQSKPLVYFKEFALPLGLNKTNAKTVVRLYGPNPKELVGKKLALYVTTTEMPGTGETVDCIRIRPRVPAELKVAQ